MTDAAEVRPSSDAVTEPAVVILSGLSGGGKTAAAKLFEDLGYTVVDNLPGELLPDLAELVSSDRERFARIAIVVDVRAGNPTMALAAMRGALEGRGILCGVTLIMHRLWGVHQNLSKFLVASNALQIIAPEPGLSLKAQASRHSIM